MLQHMYNIIKLNKYPLLIQNTLFTLLKQQILINLTISI